NKPRGPLLRYRIEEAAAAFEIVNLPRSRAIAATIDVQTPARKEEEIRITDERMDTTRVAHSATIICLHILLLPSLSHMNQRNPRATRIASAANGKHIIKNHPNLRHIVHEGRSLAVISP